MLRVQLNFNLFISIVQIPSVDKLQRGFHVLEHIATNSTVTPLSFFFTKSTIQEKNIRCIFGGRRTIKIQLLLLQSLLIFIMQSSGAMLYAIQLLEDRWQKYLIIHSFWKLTNLSAKFKT